MNDLYWNYFSIGISIFGKRRLTRDEYTENSDTLPYPYDDVIYNIATRAYVILWLPIFPTDTIIYVDVKFRHKEGTLFGTDEILDSPSIHEGEKWYKPAEYSSKDFGTRKYMVWYYHVNWKHVRSSVAFYLSPMLPFLILYQLYCLILRKSNIEN